MDGWYWSQSKAHYFCNGQALCTSVMAAPGVDMLLTAEQRDAKVAPYCKTCQGRMFDGMTDDERAARQLSETQFRSMMAELTHRTRRQEYEDRYSFGLYRDDEHDEGREDLR